MRYLLSTIQLICACLSLGHSALASEIPVRYKAGLLHGFLVLSSLDGAHLADGDLLQTTQGDRVTSRLVYHFKDGSLQDETTVFSQRRTFRLISYRLLQKGPAFPRSLDMAVEASSGRVTVHYAEADGKEKVADERMKLPADLANGLVLTLLENLAPDAPPLKVSMVIADPKPRLVKLAISSQGTEPFSLGASSHKAINYVLKVEIGGVAGLVAPLLGKQPPDSHVWILGGEAPAFVKSEVLAYVGGPMWRTELQAPTWSKTEAVDRKDGTETKH